jgi:hypothetical protein
VVASVHALVLELALEVVHAGPRPVEQRRLRLLVDEPSARRVLDVCLRGSWLQTDVRAGDLVSLCLTGYRARPLDVGEGGWLDRLAQPLLVDDECNLLIVTCARAAPPTRPDPTRPNPRAALRSGARRARALLALAHAPPPPHAGPPSAGRRRRLSPLAGLTS